MLRKKFRLSPTTRALADRLTITSYNACKQDQNESKEDAVQTCVRCKPTNANGMRINTLSAAESSPDLEADSISEAHLREEKALVYKSQAVRLETLFSHWTSKDSCRENGDKKQKKEDGKEKPEKKK